MPVTTSAALFRIVLVLAVIGSAWSYCHRPGFVCMNGGQCTPNKTCECTADYGGYDCRAPQALVNCLLPCNNHGVCVLGSQCYCDFGWYGESCQYQNESISCNMFGMDITMAVPGLRDISIHGSDDCSLPLDKSLLTQHVYAFRRTFPHSPTPGGVCDVYTRTDAGPGFFSYHLTLSARREKNKLAPLDWLTEFTCSYERTALSTTYPNEKYERFGVGLADFLNEPIPNGGSTTQSKEFSLVFYSHIADHNVQVVELSAYNVWTGMKMYDLIIDSCPSYHGSVMLMTNPFEQDYSKPDGSVVKATFITINPLNDAMELYFDYKLRLCMGLCPRADCATKRIPANLPGLRLILH